MKNYIHQPCSALVIVGFFLLVSLFMTYRIIALPSLVIGDNFYWTKQTIEDVLGPRVIRESFLGDVAVLSTFKTGFLFPLAYALSSMNIPMTVIYPFLFYLLSMLSFYSLSMEFLRTRIFRVLVSVAYVVNPVTPYYFASIQNAFVLIFLPLTLKFFAKTLREFDQLPQPKSSKNLLLTAFFFALSVSAHEQFLLSALLMMLFMSASYVYVAIRKYGRSRYSLLFPVTGVLTFFSVFVLVNLPLFFSLINVSKAPMSLYFTGRLSDFMNSVRYTYSTANLGTLLRFGGDSGVGLGKSSWYDSGMPANVLGYWVFIVFAISILLLIMNRKARQKDRGFFCMTVALFAAALGLLFFVKQLPDNEPLLQALFNLVIQTWESPTKLRIVALVAALPTTFVVFQKIENLGKTLRLRIFRVGIVLALLLSIVAYNGPWLISYVGQTPVQQVSDSMGLSPLFDVHYSRIADLVGRDLGQERGLLFPYMYKGQLYVPPKFRLFQLVSPTNSQMNELVKGSHTSWSRVFGLLSAKYAVLDGNYSSNDIMIFPNQNDINVSDAIEAIKSDPGFKFTEQADDFTVLETQDALPRLYATKYYVFYDDINTVGYAVQLLDLKNFPVFIKSEQANALSMPYYISGNNYEVYALSPHNASSSNLTLQVSNASNSYYVNLTRTAILDYGVDVFSGSYKLEPGNVVSAINSKEWHKTMDMEELVLNSTTFALGEFRDSFNLNFTLNILQRGEYSFQGPRVVINASPTKKHFIIFHDNGGLELALLKEGKFTSGLRYGYGYYDLAKEGNSINVTMSKVFDELQIRVNGNLSMTFPIEANTSTVALSSESSTSRFTKINVEERDIVRLFAAREAETPIGFHSVQDGPEHSELVVSDSTSDYAVVSQYLNTPLRVVESEARGIPVVANLFFSGWIIEPSNAGSKEVSLTITIADEQLTLALTAFSIFSTYVVCLVAVRPTLAKKFLAFISRHLRRQNLVKEKEALLPVD